MDFGFIWFGNPIETMQDLLNADPKARDKNGRTALIRYVQKKQHYPEVLLRLIGNKEHLDAEDNDGRTALHYSLITCEIQMMAVLIENGANVSITDNRGFNLLHAAPISMAALSKFPSLNAPEKKKLLFDNIKKVLDGGVDVTQIDSKQRTPLMVVSEADNWEIAKLYIQYGADVNYCSELDYETCLHSALSLGKLNSRLWDIPSAEMVTGLILHGADINHLDKKKESPLGRLLRSKHHNKHFFAREYIKYGVLVHWRETIDFKVSDRRFLGRLRSESDLNEMKNDCNEEIRKMRRCVLTENFNLCQFAISGFRQVAEEARTAVCVEVCNYLLRTTCPIYHDLIYSRLETPYIRQMIMKLKFMLNKKILSSDFNYLISAYLDINDMFNILKASIL